MNETPTSADGVDPILVSRQQAAELLSISRRSLDYLIADKKLPTRRIGRRVLIAYTELKKFARADHPFRISPEDREVA